MLVEKEHSYTPYAMENQKHMKSILFIITMLVTASFTHAQSTDPYWVIESNVKDKSASVLRVYDSRSFLIHEEVMKGRCLNVQSRRDRKLIAKRVKEVVKQQALVSGEKR